MIQRWRKHGEGAHFLPKWKKNTKKPSELTRVDHCAGCFSWMFWQVMWSLAWKRAKRNLGWINWFPFWFMFFLIVDMLGIDSLSRHFRSVSWFDRAHESVDFRNLAHQVQRNATFGSRSNSVSCWCTVSLSFWSLFSSPRSFSCMVLVIKILSGSLKISWIVVKNVDLKFLCTKVPRGYPSAHAEYSKPSSNSAASSRGRKLHTHMYISYHMCVFFSYHMYISLLLHVWWLTFPISPRNKGDASKSEAAELVLTHQRPMDHWWQSPKVACRSGAGNKPCHSRWNILKQLEAYACCKWNMKSSVQELSVELQVSQPISAYLHAMIRREIARGVWSLFWNESSSWQFDRIPYSFSEKEHFLQLLQPVLVDIFWKHRSGKP